jgi:outer membrane lipoprotein-sorting protein
MNKINYIIILLFAIVSIGLKAKAQDFKMVNDPAEIIQKLQESSQATKSIKSTFTQEKYLSVMVDKIISKGKFVYQKENKLRWEYTEPFEYIIVINGSSMKIKDENQISNYDMESNKMFKQINDMMVGMVSGTILSSKEFHFKYFQNTSEYKVEMKPVQKEMTSFISSIEIFLDKKDLSVNQLIMNESSEDYTKILFENKQMNTSVPASEFILK